MCGGFVNVPPVTVRANSAGLVSRDAETISCSLQGSPDGSVFEDLVVLVFNRHLRRGVDLERCLAHPSVHDLLHGPSLRGGLGLNRRAEGHLPELAGKFVGVGAGASVLLLGVAGDCDPESV